MTLWSFFIRVNVEFNIRKTVKKKAQSTGWVYLISNNIMWTNNEAQGSHLPNKIAGPRITIFCGHLN